MGPIGYVRGKYTRRPGVEEKVARIEEEVAQLLIEKGLTIATAESTTGGYIGHLLNSVAGSSRYFVGGVIAYHTRPKVELLKVPKETIDFDGSVSVQTALAMAQGVRELMQTDIGISETGVAGPTGGSAEHPVGTVFIAVSARDKGYQLAERYAWQADRLGFKERTAGAALALVRHYLRR